MNDRPTSQVHVSSRTRNPSIPDFDTRIRCEKHPHEDPEQGYGLAGGGYGVYSFCARCNRVLSKSEDME